MTPQEKHFEEVVDATLNRIKNLLIEKGKEYRRNNDPYHNFNVGALKTSKTPEEVLQGFLLKHLISVEDIRNDLKIGILPSVEKVNEKYDDIIAYFAIEKAMVLSRIENKKL